ncbi:MAG: zinc ribbon domain-containing protein [Anaerolineae bacterium]|nr:zinc ribbon domain-containing protein [Anaerolineae bacterium]
MDAFTLTAIVVLVVASLALILYPVLQQDRPTPGNPNPLSQSLEELETRYQAALAAIRELMLDHETGKVATADYEPLLARAKIEAAKIRQQIDHLTRQPALDPHIEAEIERLVAETRAGLSGKNGETPQAITFDLEAEVDAEIRRLQNAGAVETITCPTCGKTGSTQDSFCSGCGQPLASPAEAERSADHCPSCGYAFEPGDAFCAQCGIALRPVAESNLSENS